MAAHLTRSWTSQLPPRHLLAKNSKVKTSKDSKAKSKVSKETKIHRMGIQNEFYNS